MKLWEPKRMCPKAVPRHLQKQCCGHGSSNVVWSHMLPGPQPNAISMNFYPCRSSCVISRINQRCWAFGVPWSPGYVLGLPPRGGLWKKSKWPWNMIHLMPCRNPWRLLHPILHSYTPLVPHVKRAWTCSAFSTNKSVWNVMVTGSQSHVWNGPYQGVRLHMQTHEWSDHKIRKQWWSAAAMPPALNVQAANKRRHAVFAAAVAAAAATQKPPPQASEQQRKNPFICTVFRAADPSPNLISVL